MFNYRFRVILPHKKFTWTDFRRVYIPYILTPSLRDIPNGAAAHAHGHGSRLLLAVCLSVYSAIPICP